MTTTNFPNGQALISSALTAQAMSTLFQTIALQMLGIDSTTDTHAYSKVRINWPTTGQPGGLITDDICYIEAKEVDDDYGMIRDAQFPANDDTTTNVTFTYTRVWEIRFVLYGPNSYDNARVIRSAVLLDFSHDFLAESNVYLVPDTPSPRRVPYEFNSQWWERTDLRLKFNEGVTETTVVTSGASVEIKLYNESGQVADFTVS